MSTRCNFRIKNIYTLRRKSNKRRKQHQFRTKELSFKRSSLLCQILLSDQIIKGIRNTHVNLTPWRWLMNSARIISFNVMAQCNSGWASELSDPIKLHLDIRLDGEDTQEYSRPMCYVSTPYIAHNASCWIFPHPFMFNTPILFCFSEFLTEA